MKKLRKIGKIAIPAVGVVAAGAGAVKTYGDYNKTDNTLMLLNAEGLTAYADPTMSGASGAASGDSPRPYWLPSKEAQCFKFIPTNRTRESVDPRGKVVKEYEFEVVHTQKTTLYEYGGFTSGPLPSGALDYNPTVTCEDMGYETLPASMKNDKYIWRQAREY